MATSYGTYSLKSNVYKFGRMDPICHWDNETYTCKSCEKEWKGGTTCFYCCPNMLTFLMPRKEYLQENEFDMSKVPLALKNSSLWKEEKKIIKKYSITELVNFVKRDNKALQITEQMNNMVLS